jgi:hypothetical protein
VFLSPDEDEFFVPEVATTDDTDGQTG